MLLNILKYLEVVWRFLIHWMSANIWRKTRLGIVTFLRFAYLIQLQIQCTPCHVADLYILRDVRSAIHSSSAVQPRRKLLGSKPELHHHKNVYDKTTERNRLKICGDMSLQSNSVGFLPACCVFSKLIAFKLFVLCEFAKFNLVLLDVFLWSKSERINAWWKHTRFRKRYYH